MLKKRLENILSSSHYLSHLRYTGSKVYSFHGTDDHNDFVYELFILRFLSLSPYDRDGVHKEMVAKLADFLLIFQDLLQSKDLKLSPTCSPQGFHSLLNRANLSVEPVNLVPIHSLTELEPYPGEGRPIVNEGTVFFPVAEPLACPYVVLDQDQFAYEQMSGHLAVFYNGSTDHVEFPHFYITGDHTVLVCVTQYQNLFTDEKEKSTIHDITTHDIILYWISLGTLVLSLVFLVLSFVVYCLLPSLRNAAGINNIILITALFAAQLLLLVSSRVAGVDWLCQVVGVALHYCWLAVAFAQNACTLHMFFVLSFPFLSHATIGDIAGFAKRYTAYVLLTSLTLVVATLAWQWGAEGQSGYGGPNCYITKALVRIVMFAVPLGCTVLANVAMFVFTIMRMGRGQAMEGTRRQRNSLLLYTKLSVFTGLTWLLGFLHTALGSVVLMYLFAVLQGCQGLFIFLAFLANKRVLAMLKERVCQAGAVETTCFSKLTARGPVPSRGSGVNSREPAFSKGSKAQILDPVSTKSSKANTRQQVSSRGPKANMAEHVSSKGSKAKMAEPVSSKGPKAKLAEPVSSKGPKANMAEPVSSKGPKAKMAEPVSSKGAKAKVAEPVSSKGPKAKMTEPVSSKGPKAKLAEPVSSKGPKASTAEPVSSKGPKAKVAEPVSSKGAKAKVAEPVSSKGPNAKLAEPVSSKGPKAKLAEPVSSNGPKAKVAEPVSSKGPKAKLAELVSSKGPKANTAEPVSSKGPKAKLAEPVSSKGPKASTAEPVSLKGPKAKLAESVSSKGPKAKLAEPVSSKGPKAKLAEPVSSKGPKANTGKRLS